MTTPLDKILDSAFDAYNHDQLDLSEELTRQVLTSIPNHGDGLYLLGLIAYQRGAIDNAINILFQLVKSYPAIETYTLFLASLLQGQGRWTEAMRYYQKFPNNALGVAEQGFICLNQKNKSKAKRLFQNALTLNPNLPEAQLGLALCSNDGKKLAEIAKATNLPDAWFYLSRFYQKNHEDKAALQAIDNTGLKSVAYLIEKGIILERLNQSDAALKVYKQAAEMNPYRSDVWTNQANIFRKNNQLNASEDYYKRALAQDADDMMTRHNLAALLFQMDRIPESLEQYRFILSHNPQDSVALYNLAVILEKTGEWAEALGIYFKLLIGKEKFEDIDWRIADSLSALAEQGKDTQKLAKDFAEGWIKIDPKNPVAQHSYAALTQTPEKNMLAYVKRLYDSFASTYQDKMSELQAKAISEIIPLIPKKTYKKVLDLGCGTGLFGVAFQNRAKSIVGVDISNEMLKKASETKTYTKLFHTDIISFLSQNKGEFDLITAIEVLEYCPNLDGIFAKIGNTLTRNGLFVLTAELAENGPCLAPNGRYLCSSDYMIEKLNKFRLNPIQTQDIKLRKDGTGFAMGRIFICRSK